MDGNIQAEAMEGTQISHHLSSDNEQSRDRTSSSTIDLRHESSAQSIGVLRFLV